MDINSVAFVRRDFKYEKDKIRFGHTYTETVSFSFQQAPYYQSCCFDL